MIQPVVIIGAPRSGTNMLRDVLAALPDFGTWPCDEINYIWRHGNRAFPTDEFPAELATPKVCGYIRCQFERMRNRLGVTYLVEKTCANALRVEFVDRVLPDAKYIFIRRSGTDAAASAIKRWRAPLNLLYVLRKARFVPLVDLPYYAGNYLANRLHKLLSSENSVSTWGPKFSGMQELAKTRSVAEISAMQWRACVERSREAQQAIPANRWIEVRYEDFVSNPVTQLKGICAFLQVPVADDQIDQAVAGVRQDSVGLGKKGLDEKVLAEIENILDR